MKLSEKILKLKGKKIRVRIVKYTYISDTEKTLYMLPQYNFGEVGQFKIISNNVESLKISNVIINDNVVTLVFKGGASMNVGLQDELIVK